MEEKKIYQDKMDKTMEVLLADYGTIRAGRANPHVLDKIKVDYYGTPTPLQQVGNVSVPEARMIVIQPWEKSLLKAIEKAILTSELGINPTNDAKVAVRNIRRDANDAFKKAEKAGEITEDELADLTEKMQKLTDKTIERVDKAVEEKTKEIMTV